MGKTMANENAKQFVFYSDKLNYKTLEGAKGKEFFVEGYISTGDLDLVNDMVTKSCMDDMITQFDGRSIKLDFEHETLRGKSALDSEANKSRIPLGKAVGRDRDAKGVKIRWKMNPNWKKFDEKGNITMDFKDIWDNVETEMYDAFSIAYVPTKTTNMQQQGKSVRMLDSLNLLNVALTGNPINPAATMSAVMAKSLEFMKSKEGDEIQNIEIKDRIKQIESAVADIKSDLSDNNVDKENMGCKPMEQIKDKEPEANTQSPETPVDQGKENEAEGAAKPAEESTEESTEAPAAEAAEATEAPEGKSITLMELKSVVETLTKSVDELRKENADLKAIVEKPLQKAKGAENQEAKSQKTEESTSQGPLDLVA